MENPIDETTTIAEMLRPAAVSAEPQVIGAAPLRMAIGPERIWGKYYCYESVSKAGIKRPEAAYNVNATNTNAPIRTIVPATMSTKKNLAHFYQCGNGLICSLPRRL